MSENAATIASSVPASPSVNLSNVLTSFVTAVAAVPAVEQDAENVGGQHGTSTESRLTALEQLIADLVPSLTSIGNTLAHLFPGHF